MSPGEVEERVRAAAQNALEASVLRLKVHPVIETFRGEVVWEGVVTEFMTVDRRHAYAWAAEGEKEPQFIAVVQKPPILTPLDAVRAWIVSQGGR